METTAVEVTETMLKCAYFLLSADGKIEKSELAKFDEFGTQYSNFKNSRSEIIAECEDSIKNNGVKNSTENELQYSYLSDEQKRYLIWILVNIGYADAEYSDVEKELIDFIAEKLDVNESVVLELEDSAETLLSLEEKKKFILDSKQSYSAKKKILFFKVNYMHKGKSHEEIESELQMIKNDKEEIINSINALVLIG